MKVATLITVGLLTFVPSLACADDTLQFDGAIAVEPLANGTGTDATSQTVTRNIVRDVQPAADPWRIAAFRAEVTAGGHISAIGKGLVFAGGDTIGTALLLTPDGPAANIKVFATLICEPTAPFTENNSQPVPLAANGSFQIDDTLSPAPPSPCDTPVLFIRNAANLSWFAVGVPVQ